MKLHAEIMIQLISMIRLCSHAQNKSQIIEISVFYSNYFATIAMALICLRHMCVHVKLWLNGRYVQEKNRLISYLGQCLYHQVPLHAQTRIIMGAF
jgi:hypothetical protein